MQNEDPVLSPIIQKNDQNGVSPQVSNYFINLEGLLCHLSKRPSRSPRSNTTRKQVCIPHCLKARILESIHSEYGGHLKFFKTYYRLSKIFFWQNMYKDTKNFVRSCTLCLSRKNAFKIPPAPHQPVEQSQEPGETCHIVIFGPLKTTPKGNRFLRNLGGASGQRTLWRAKLYPCTACWPIGMAVDGSAELSCFVLTDELNCFVHVAEWSCSVPAAELSCSFLLLS
ncbi:integrase_H2C2 domain-containing protein [Trichonephila clavipes]|nr:integrase_H2C2 domain-containing protein [Trichonephila clavipes]